MNYSLVRLSIIGVSTLAGMAVSVLTRKEKKDDKDAIIADLSEKYNALVDAINAEDEEDEAELDDEEADEIELRIEDTTSQLEDEPAMEYYPQKFVEECKKAQEQVQSLYTDIEDCNDGEIEQAEDQLLDETNAIIGMLCTAYQLMYSDGLNSYISIITEKSKAIKRIKNYDSSIKTNKAELIKTLTSVSALAEKLNSKLKLLKLNNDTEPEQAEETEEEKDNRDYTVPVYHKKGVAG